MRTACIMALAMLIVAPAAAAQTGPGRYQLERSGEGFVRLDTETGTVAYCAAKEGVWRCDNMPGGVLAQSREPHTLEDRLASIEARLSALEGSSRPTGLPSDSEVDRMLDIFGRVLDKFKDFARDLDEKPPQPPQSP